MMEEEEGLSPFRRETLLSSCPLLTEAQKETLSEAQIHTLDQLLVLEVSGLCKHTDVDQAQRIVAAVLGWYGGQRSDVLTEEFLEGGARGIDTGRWDGNALFGGAGLPVGAVAEFVGGAAVGKTQLCMWYACNVARANAERCVLYISSSNCVSSERIVSFLPMNADLDNVLERIHVINCYDYEQLMVLLHQLRDDVQWVSRGAAPVTGVLDAATLSSLALVIVDSTNPLFQPITGKQPFGHSLMFAFRSLLKDIGAACGASVLVTNTTVVTDNNTVKSSMGPSWELVCNPRVWFEPAPDQDDCSIVTIRGVGPPYTQRKFRMAIRSDDLIFSEER